MDYTVTRNGAVQAELWFDYMADTGDGWESTYAMACLVAQPWIELGDRRLPHGDFLLLGGTRCTRPPAKRSIATGSSGRWKRRCPGTLCPAANCSRFPAITTGTTGSSASRGSSAQHRTLGGWQTRQRRSYFALQLPGHWWLWAVDVQLDIRHRRRPAQLLSLGLEGTLPRRRHHPGQRRAGLAVSRHQGPAGGEQPGLPRAEDHRADGRRGARLGGRDAHHYRRHEHTRDARYQRITSGGGGAYLSATHMPVSGGSATTLKRTVRVGEETFHEQFAYPSPSTSLRAQLPEPAVPPEELALRDADRAGLHDADVGDDRGHPIRGGAVRGASDTRRAWCGSFSSWGRSSSMRIGRCPPFAGWGAPSTVWCRSPAHSPSPAGAPRCSAAPGWALPSRDSA